jgi:ARG and Rhodanese-Phosphatase-superfamily-associated Protein domain
MNKAPLTISEPYTHENLTIFLFHGRDEIDGSRYVSLQEALHEKHVLVHETGTVGQLEAENLSETIDIFVQAGDVLKGGRQDRTLGIDFIIPARSGRLPIPTFCVESGRWHRRHGEDDRHFGSSSHSIHAKAMRLAAKAAHDQSAVWHSVAKSQEALGAALNKSVHDAHSPTSYQLSVEDCDLQKRKRNYETKLRRIVEERSDVVGYAFYIIGQRNSADIYASTKLFQTLWEKLLDVAILEAISAPKGNLVVPNTRNVEAWLKQAAKAQPHDRKNAPPRTRVDTKSYENGVVFETFDESVGDHVVLHTNIISN